MKLIYDNSFTVIAINKLLPLDNETYIMAAFLLACNQGGTLLMTNTYPEAFHDLKLLHQLKEFLH